jgi:hypothetical protein
MRQLGKYFGTYFDIVFCCCQYGTQRASPRIYIYFMAFILFYFTPTSKNEPTTFCLVAVLFLESFFGTNWGPAIGGTPPGRGLVFFEASSNPVGNE